MRLIAVRSIEPHPLFRVTTGSGRLGDHPMKIAISGATGFIGTHLTAYLTGLGHRAVPLGRPAFRSQESLAAALAGCGAVVNLAGALIDRRWSDAYKKQLYATAGSGTTRKLVAAINEMNPAPKVFVSASAVGYYPDQACYDEYTAVKERASCPTLRKLGAGSEPAGSGDTVGGRPFRRSARPGRRRFRKNGFPFRKGIAVRIASGAQIFAWIDIGDLVRALTLSFRRICWPGRST